ELRKRPGAPLFVRVHDDFGVGVRGKAVAGGFEIPAELLEVVDLAVEDDRDAAVLVVDRLMSGRDVDDAQPPHAEADPRLHERSLIVGPAVAYDLAHVADERPRLVRVEAPFDGRRFHESCNPAHRYVSTDERRTALRSPCRCTWPIRCGVSNSSGGSTCARMRDPSSRNTSPSRPSCSR